MLILLIDWLREILHFKVPTAFTYFSTRMIFAAGTALLMTIFLGPRFIKKLYEMKIGQSIRTVDEVPLLAELHGKKKDTPTMGGLLILFSMVASLLLWMDLGNIFTWLLLLTTLVLGWLGAADDYLKLRHKNSKGLKAKKKMLIQVSFSALIALYLLLSQMPSQGKRISALPPLKSKSSLRAMARKLSLRQRLSPPPNTSLKSTSLFSRTLSSS